MQANNRMGRLNSAVMRRQNAGLCLLEKSRIIDIRLGATGSMLITAAR
jgi:hypothetical protein